MVSLDLASELISDKTTRSGRRIVNPELLKHRRIYHYSPAPKNSRPQDSIIQGNHRVFLDRQGRLLGYAPSSKEAKRALKALAQKRNQDSISVSELSFKLNVIASRGNKKIVLIDAGKRGNSIYGNAFANGLQVLTKVAREHGYQVQTFHMNEMSDTEIISKIKPGDIVGLSSTSPGHEHAMSLVNRLADLKDDVLILKGGKHESLAGADLQAQWDYPVDISFLGDADITFGKLLKLLNETKNLDLIEIQDQLEAIPGIAYGGRRNLSTEVRAIGKNIVKPDFVDYQVLEPFSNFRNTDPNQKMLRIMDMRGCPEHCTFCSISTLSTRITAKDLLEHIKQLVEEAQAQNPPVDIGYIFFESGTFATDPDKDTKVIFPGQNFDIKKWLHEFSVQMRNLNNELEKKYGHGLKFGIQTRASSFEEIPGYLEWLKDAGLESVYLGLESLASDATLNALGKGSTTYRATNLNAIKEAHDLGVNVTATAMVDYQQEQGAQYTVEELMKLGVNEIFAEYRKVYADTQDAYKVIDEAGNELTAWNVAQRYNTGRLHQDLGANREDEQNLVVFPLEPGNRKSKLQVVDNEALKINAQKFYAELNQLAQQYGYIVQANGHYLKALRVSQ